MVEFKTEEIPRDSIGLFRQFRTYSSKFRPRLKKYFKFVFNPLSHQSTMNIFYRVSFFSSYVKKINNLVPVVAGNYFRYE